MSSPRMSIRNVLLFLVASTAALPGLDLSKGHAWLPAKHGDSRSPCPMLNTMANHGYLPRDGRNISIPDMGVALKEGINFNAKDGEGAAQMFYTLLNATHIDLEDLNAHNLTEHDASLSREDFDPVYGGDSLHVNHGRVLKLIADAGFDKNLSPASLAKSRVRVEKIQAIPERFANQVLGEAGFLLQTMSADELPQGVDADYSKVRAPKARVAAWLSLEKLPFEFGWRKPKKEFTTAQTGGLAGTIGKELAALSGSS